MIPTKGRMVLYRTATGEWPAIVLDIGPVTYDEDGVRKQRAGVTLKAFTPDGDELVRLAPECAIGKEQIGAWRWPPRVDATITTSTSPASPA